MWRQQDERASLLFVRVRLSFGHAVSRIDTAMRGQ